MEPTTKPKTISFGSAPIAAPAKKTIAFGSAPIVSQETSEPEKKGFWGSTKELAKGLVTAPATIAARPFQAIQGGVQYLQDRPELKQFEKDLTDITKQNDMLLLERKKVKAAGGDTANINKQLAANIKKTTETTGAMQPTIDRRPFSGGIIAPVPENFADVKKDVGRGVQTVALGLGPVSGGAAFGTGSSLEQGNDLFSVETAFNTVLGAGAGKVLDLVGKPLFNAAGKAVGVITPQVLKDVAKGGADAITKFAAQHEILPAVAKTAVGAFEKGANAVDEGVNKLFTGAGNKIKDTVTSQYPGLSKENLQNRFRKVEETNFARPSTEPKAMYKKATEIYEKAKANGNDLGKTAVDNGITHDSLIDGKVYSTLDTGDLLRQDAMKTSHDLLRPALAEAELGIQKVPIAEVRQRLLNEVDNIPRTQITDAERALMKKNIGREYGDNSPAAKVHPDGYTLTDLHDAKIVTSGNAKYKPNGTNADNFKANTSKTESDAFRKLLEEKAPPELDIKSFNKELQKKFELADYLEALNNKKVPSNWVANSIDFAGKIIGAKIGASVGGGLGGVAGYHMGGVLFDSFERMPNPLKGYYLRSIEKAQPEIFNAFKNYVGEQEAARLMRLQLPAPGKNVAPDLMNKMNERGAVEMGYPSRPTTEGERMQNNIQQNGRRLFNTPQLNAPSTIYKGPTQNDLPYTPNKLFGTTPAVETKTVIPKKNSKIGDFYSPEATGPVAQKAAELTKKNGGVTINLKGDVPTQGFAYSPYKDVETVIPEAKFSQADVDNFVEKYYDKLSQEGHHLGVWVDDGKVYIDISKVNPDENAAVADSIANSQIGLFDLSTFETKLTKDYEKIGNTYIHKRQE